MEGADVLLTIAELAVAFAGFASIVTLFQHRDPASWPASVPVRLRAMVEASLGTLYGALFPFLLHHMGLTGDALWRAASAAGLVGFAYMSVSMLLRARPQLPSGEMSTRFTYGLGAVALAIAALLACNVAGAPFPPGFGPYLAAVVYSLVVASFVFLRMIVRPISGDAA